MRFLALATVLSLLGAGCTSTDPGAPRPVADPPSVQNQAESRENSMASTEETATLQTLLEQSQIDPDLRETLDLLVECRSETGMRAMRVWGDGLVVWQGSRQSLLEPEEVTAVLERLILADFVTLSPLYGGPRPRDQPENGSAVLIVCRIRVSLDGRSQESAQRAKGEQSERLKSLAEDLLAIGEEATGDGVEAVDLLDGLEKVGRGELDPRVFRVMLHRKPTAEELDDSGPGFLMRVEGQEVTSRRHDPQTGYGEQMALHLDSYALRNLALVLADLDPAAMPVNLWAPAYTEVTVEVLDHRKSVQARQFAGLEPITHGDLQESFDLLVRTLVRLQEQVAAEGAPEAG